MHNKICKNKRENKQGHAKTKTVHIQKLQKKENCTMTHNIILVIYFYISNIRGSMLIL